MQSRELFEELRNYRKDDTIDKLNIVDPLIYNFYLNKKINIKNNKSGKYSEHDSKIMDILEKIEIFADTLEDLDIEEDRERINKELNHIHQKIDNLEATYRKQKSAKINVKRVVISKNKPGSKLLKAIDKMPKYKVQKIKY